MLRTKPPAVLLPGYYFLSPLTHWKREKEGYQSPLITVSDNSLFKVPEDISVFGYGFITHRVHEIKSNNRKPY
jgi:hypothetical protein